MELEAAHPMETQRDHDEIQELLGAYALHAVDTDEAAEIYDHLRSCPRCRAEVVVHRETAALLVDTHLEPPADLWDTSAPAGSEEARGGC